MYGLRSGRPRRGPGVEVLHLHQAQLAAVDLRHAALRIDEDAEGRRRPRERVVGLVESAAGVHGRHHVAKALAAVLQIDASEEALSTSKRLLQVSADDHQVGVIPLQLRDVRDLGSAGDAPASPEVKVDRVTAELAEANALAVVHAGDLELRGELAGHGADLEVADAGRARRLQHLGVADLNAAAGGATALAADESRRHQATDYGPHDDQQPGQAEEPQAQGTAASVSHAD